MKDLALTTGEVIIILLALRQRAERMAENANKYEDDYWQIAHDEASDLYFKLVNRGI